MMIYKLSSDLNPDTQKALKDIKNITAKNGTAVAFGRFDALHIGHMQIIKKAVEYAKVNDLLAAVFLFDNEPSEVVTGKIVPRINEPEKRYKVLKSLGVDLVVEKRFDRNFMNLTCEEFVDKYTVSLLNAKFAAVGFNYHFGKGGKGDTKTLNDLCQKQGIKVYAAEEISYLGDTVSSTRIRQNIMDGDMETVKILMGRSFELSGIVTKGNQIGKNIGFPTANIPIVQGSVIPKSGVYISEVEVDEKKYLGITNVGSRPTVDEPKRCIESHIIGKTFDDLYGKRIYVRFLKYIRDIEKFKNVDGLTAQLENDCKTAEEYFKNHIEDTNK